MKECDISKDINIRALEQDKKYDVCLKDWVDLQLAALDLLIRQVAAAPESLFEKG